MKKIVKKTNEVKLSSGRVVKVKDMSIDDMDFCNDVTTMHQDSGGGTYFSGLAKARTSWLRRGIEGGEINDFKLDSNGLVDDSVLKQMNDVEKNELTMLIQEHQNMGEEKPSH